MTTPTTGADRMRKDFESYMASRGFDGSSFDLDEDGDYENSMVQARWECWQAAKQTPMVYDPTPRKSILTDEAVEAGMQVLQVMDGVATDEAIAKSIFHAMEAKQPAWTTSRIQELERLCAEAYQVIGSMSDDLGCPEAAGKVVKVLDNLSAARLVHEDVLPFPSFELTFATPAAQAQEPMHPVAEFKWADLQKRGYQLDGYAFCKTDGQAVHRGFITFGGMVGWWRNTDHDPLPPATTPDPKQSA